MATSHCNKKQKYSMKEMFIQQLLISDQGKQSHYNILTAEQYTDLIEEVKEALAANRKTTMQYRRLKRFDILLETGVQKLIAKSKSDEIRYHLPVEEIFDVIESTHIALDHCGRCKLKQETSKKCANITIEMINLFLSMCDACQMKRNKKREYISKPITHTELNTHFQVDLIDMQSQPDGANRFIMVYQDQSTKFIILRTLQSNCVKEVADQVNDIFSLFGAPCILHSNNGKDFVNQLISKLTDLWPEVKLVRAKLQYSRQSQASTERVNKEIERMLCTWMKDNNTNKWAEGLRYIQFTMNGTYHSDIGKTPYKAMFGTEPKIGLTSSCLSSDVVNVLKTEEELEMFVANMPQTETDSPLLAKSSKQAKIACNSDRSK